MQATSLLFSRYLEINMKVKQKTLRFGQYSGLLQEKQKSLKMIQCSCGSFYIGEMVRRLGTRVKEHREACIHGDTKKSAVSEHAWTYQHPIMWTKAEVLDRACRHDVLRFKEAIHIQTSTGHFNRDVGVDIPECWPALLNLMDK